jgi:hypothetical protein
MFHEAASHASQSVLLSLVTPLVTAAVGIAGAWWIGYKNAHRLKDEAVSGQLLEAQTLLSWASKEPPSSADLDAINEVAKKLNVLRVGHKRNNAILQTAVEISEVADTKDPEEAMRRAKIVRLSMMARHPEIFANWAETIEAFQTAIRVSFDEKPKALPASTTEDPQSPGYGPRPGSEPKE